MYPGYLNLGCAEIINSERAAAYAGSAGVTIECDRCPDLPEALEHDPYTTPRGDDAPWYDAARPSSEEFFGVIGGEVTGISHATFKRTPTPLVGDGSAIGPLRREHREMAYTVTALAQSEAGLSYGMEWLSRSLSGLSCGDGCQGTDMAVFAHCPGDSYDPEGEDDLRYLYDVGVMEGPTVTERTWINESLVWATVTFTLVAGNPWVFGEPLAGQNEWRPLSSGELSKEDPDQVYEECPSPAPCAEDPYCPPQTLPPAPPEPVSPCYTKGVDTFRVTRLQVAPEEHPAWPELVPLVEIYSGGGELRRLLVRFWSNPFSMDCNGDVDPCAACADINVSYVPPNARLTIDGRTRRSVIECISEETLQTSKSYPNLFGAKGGAFTYPAFPCPGGLCVEIWSLNKGMSGGTIARVSLVPRVDAI